jgi:uncharacterized membrane-anchored protein YhcB (DUF1043 family)
MDYIATLIPLITAIVGFLMARLFKKDDKSDEETQQTLKEVKDLLDTVNLNLNTIKINLEHTVHDTRELQRESKTSITKVNNIEKEVAILTTINNSSVKRLDLLQDIVTKSLK